MGPVLLLCPALFHPACRPAQQGLGLGVLGLQLRQLQAGRDQAGLAGIEQEHRAFSVLEADLFALAQAADWHRLNTAGAAGLDEAAQTGGAANSQAFRLGLIAWRIAGLLTVLRCFENGQAPAGRLVCDPTDVGTALAMMDTARALTVLTTLPNPSAPSGGGKFAAKAEQETRVRELNAQGLSVREIADQTGQHFTTVARWLRE